jgi:hypothetical protein
MTTLAAFLLEVEDEFPQEPQTAKQQRSQQVGQAEIPLPNGPETGESDSGGSGGIPPRWPPPTDRDRHGDGRPGRPPRWQRMVLWGIVIMLAAVLGSFLGRGIGQIGVWIERGMSPEAGEA